jgi:hypothetical protein
MTFASFASADFIGYAYDLETQEFLYTEHHSYPAPNKHQVLYKEANGSVFATKSLDYQHSAYAPDFVQENKRNGEQISSQKDDNDIIIRYKEDDTSSLKQDTIAYSSNLIIDAGFDHFITQNWDVLITGKAMTIDYVIPSRLDYYELTVEKETCEINGHYCFSISASSFFISLFSSQLKLTYNEAATLVSFQGRSNICDAEGNYQDVNIFYQYDES